VPSCYAARGGISRPLGWRRLVLKVDKRQDDDDDVDGLRKGCLRLQSVRPRQQRHRVRRGHAFRTSCFATAAKTQTKTTTDRRETRVAVVRRWHSLRNAVSCVQRRATIDARLTALLTHDSHCPAPPFAPRWTDPFSRNRQWQWRTNWLQAPRCDDPTEHKEGTGLPIGDMLSATTPPCATRRRR
jgi:hypothetical protein